MTRLIRHHILPEFGKLAPRTVTRNVIEAVARKGRPIGPDQLRTGRWPTSPPSSNG